MRKIILFAFLAIFPLSVYAIGTTGKIAGRVLDKATNEPLIGASVRVEGTKLGGSTDINGKYTILNVPVGVYTVKVSYVGYQDVTATNLNIIADQTAELNFQLQTKDVLTKEIVVQAERPLVEKSTSSTQVISAEQIQNLPSRGVASVVGYAAGVIQDERNSNNTYVRGGRAGELAYIVDGVSQNNPYNNLNSGTVSSAAVQEIVFLSGGFDAEYGNANSGIANITTKDPNIEKYSVNGEALSDGLWGQNKKFLGVNSYGYNVYNASIAGPLIPGQSSWSKVASVYLFVERTYQADAVPTYGFGILPSNSLASWNISGKLKLDLGNSADIKIGENYLTSSRLNYTYTRGNQIYATSAGSGTSTYAVGNDAADAPRTETRTLSTYIKYTQALSAKSILTANLNYYHYLSEQGDNISFDNLNDYGLQSSHPGLDANGELGNAYDAQQLYIKPGVPFNLFTKQISDYYEVTGRYETQVNVHNIVVGGNYRYNTLRFYSINPRALQDTSGLALGIASGGKSGLSGIGAEIAYANKLKTYGNADSSAKAQPLLTQAYQEGLGASSYGYDIFGNQTDASNNGDNVKHPIVGSFYIQDKIELKDFIISLGLRYDYFNANDKAIIDLQNPLGYGPTGQLTDADYKNSKASSTISPRIAFSFPISDRTVFHAQFGKFTQAPSLQFLYQSRYNAEQIYLGNSGAGAVVQNPNLVPEKTTSYEVGFRQQFGQYIGLDVTAYYKQVSDLIEQYTVTPYQSTNLQPYITYANTDYAVTRGFEVSLRLERVSYVSASINYTLGYAEGTGSNANSQALLQAQGANAPVFALPLSYDQRHTGSINVDVRTPQDDESLPSWERGWGANLLFTFNSGRPYTLKSYTADIISQGNYTAALGEYPSKSTVISPINGEYLTWNFRLDLRVDKSFRLFDKVSTQIYLSVINVLNTENIAQVYSDTGLPNATSFLASPVGQGNISSYGAGYVSQYQNAENNPINFGVARQLRLGLTIGL
jgi:outer membrane receptor protein involved in Fe transport